MVSMSMTWMFLKPERARFLRSSQPRPPAPITRIFILSMASALVSPLNISGVVKGPGRVRILSRYFHLAGSEEGWTGPADMVIAVM